MTIDLYLMQGSAPCRAVLLTAKALNLDINQKTVDLRKGEHLTPEYLKLNPQHTIPTLVDDGFSIWESRAIMAYLVNKYGKGSGLYPEDPKTRAIVDQRLYFDMGTLYHRYGDYFYPQIMGGAPADEEKRKKLEEALELLDKFLEGQTYLAGSNMTIADLTTIATVSSFLITDMDFRKYANVNRWFEKIKAEAPGYKEINEAGLEIMKTIIEEMRKKK